MSKEDFEKFRQLVLQDLSLQEKLRDIEDRKVFNHRIIELSRGLGFEISIEEIDEAMRASRRTWAEKWI